MTSETEGDLLEITLPATGKLVFNGCTLNVPNGGVIQQVPVQHGHIEMYNGQLICKREPLFAPVLSLYLGADDAPDDALDDAGETA